MRAGLVSSAVLHAGIIGFMLVSFSSARPFEPMQESMPVDIISDAEMSQMMAGKKDAPKAEAPKPVVEKVAPPKPAEQLDAKVDDAKPEVKAANEPAPPPPPPPAEAKPEPKPPAAQAQAKPEPTPPSAAESLASKPPEPKKDEPKPEQQAQAKPAPAPPKKPKDIPPKVVQTPPQDQQREFKPNEIAALLDKRTATRQAAVGDTINSTAALGARVGTASTLSQTEIDALRARLMQLWSPPAGASNPEELVVTVRLRLNPDGTLSGPPMVLTSGTSQFFMAARESAMRAIFRGQPFNMLSPAKYDSWKDIEVTFDPREMVRG
ncbi:colicin import membrane protein [Angulomicrobium tetraedrale]|uniref:Colicin import membrane protein n=1 Tax=Ancylobacter tetraedralis TaxID=217068 RepID=A0A839ZCI2_9HYPH|nr:cell envelope biogenesis protein TolA [Ancylobacter tetraedralis]MBB3772396.1 colicin import membrane protein [Ancylobacter tetraedralis]